MHDAPKGASAWLSEPAGLRLDGVGDSGLPRTAVTAPTASFGRITRSVDFERVLGMSTCARSTHFAIHHLRDVPLKSYQAADPPQLSTGVDDVQQVAVENSTGRWLGLVVPKRHARRSVTRSLLKRQIRAAVSRQAALGCGLWVVRLRAPFDRKLFPSAASAALSRTAATELASVLAQAASRTAG